MFLYEAGDYRVESGDGSCDPDFCRSGFESNSNNRYDGTVRVLRVSIEVLFVS